MIHKNTKNSKSRDGHKCEIKGPETYGPVGLVANACKGIDKLTEIQMWFITFKNNRQKYALLNFRVLRGPLS